VPPRDEPGVRIGVVTTRGSTLAALLAVLGRPTWWVLGLAGFLARGGILLFVLSTATLPSPLALSNIVAPLLVPIVFGGVTPFLVAVIGLGIGSVVAWILVGAWLGAATEVVLIRDARRVALEEGLPARSEITLRRWVVLRVAAAHLLAHIPLGAALAASSVAIVNVTYTELVNPFEVVTPLPIRIARAATTQIAAIVLAWIAGEIAGGIAARRIVVRGDGIVRAVTGAYGEMLARPWSSVLPALLTLAVLVVDLAAMLAAVDIAWTAARGRLTDLPADGVEIGFAIVAFAAAWCLALAVAGLISAWRSVAMTLEADRAAVAAGAAVAPRAADGPDDAGTIGASTHRRPGDWSAGSSGGSL